MDQTVSVRGNAELFFRRAHSCAGVSQSAESGPLRCFEQRLHIRRARVHGRLRHAAIRRLRSVEARSGAWVRGRAGGLFRRVLESCGKISREGPVSDGIETVGGKYQSATEDTHSLTAPIRVFGH